MQAGGGFRGLGGRHGANSRILSQIPGPSKFVDRSVPEALESKLENACNLYLRKMTERPRVSSGLYLALMVGVIGILTAFFVRALFWKRCTSCGVRNSLDARECKQCNSAFPED